jgi:hypothetical protein
MAVALRRSGLTLWVAWVVAAGVGTALSVLAAPVSNFVDYYVSIAVRLLPFVLLQYLVLRAIVGIRPASGAVWVIVSLLAAVAFPYASILWGQQVILRAAALSLSESLTNRLLDGDQFIYALLFGLAQGAVLAWFLRLKLVAVVWIAANVLAVVVAPGVSGSVYSALLNGGPQSTRVLMLSVVVYAMAYAAVTGLALVAIVKSRRPARAPAPVAR